MQIKELLTSLHPKVSEMAFMSQLTNGKFQKREEILRSEVVELYRALDTRQRIQDIYKEKLSEGLKQGLICLLYTSPSPRDRTRSRMPSSA